MPVSFLYVSFLLISDVIYLAKQHLCILTQFDIKINNLIFLQLKYIFLRKYLIKLNKDSIILIDDKHKKEDILSCFLYIDLNEKHVSNLSFTNNELLFFKNNLIKAAKEMKNDKWFIINNDCPVCRNKMTIYTPNIFLNTKKNLERQFV